MHLVPLLVTLLTLFTGWDLSSSSADPIVYLSWQDSPTTTMVVSWITPEGMSSDVVQYRSVENEQWLDEAGTHRPLPEGRDDLTIHQVKLSGLLPETEYEFTLPHSKEVFRFKTLPEEIHRPLNFVVGGDLYHDFSEILRETMKQASRKDPDFAVLGGDLTYATHKYGRYPEDSKRWITFLRLWQEEMVTSDGRMIPIISAIGNEETVWRYNQTPEEAPYFYALFREEGAKYGYQLFDIGSDLTIWLLDTGHTAPITGEQTEWLQKTLQEREDRRHKIAVYHVPAYPSYRPVDYKYSVKIRKNWVPLFDQYGLHVAFEHHDHDYKRTKLLKNNQVDSNGTLYLGDGGFGVAVPRKPVAPEERWYLAKTASKRHFYLNTIYPNGKRHYQAIDGHGVLFDEFWDKRSADFLPAYLGE